jgi:hypothetical protein
MGGKRSSDKASGRMSLFHETRRLKQAFILAPIYRVPFFSREMSVLRARFSVYIARAVERHNRQLRLSCCAFSAGLIVLAATLAMSVRLRSGGGKPSIDHEDAACTVRSIIAG